MHTLKWQRITDSDGTTIMYTAVAGRDSNREPYRSYRIYPAHSLRNVNRVIGYTVCTWSPTLGRGVEIGSVPFDHGTGEYTLAAAKRAAQDHHNTTQAHV